MHRRLRQTRISREVAEATSPSMRAGETLSVDANAAVRAPVQSSADALEAHASGKDEAAIREGLMIVKKPLPVVAGADRETRAQPRMRGEANRFRVQAQHPVKATKSRRFPTPPMLIPSNNDGQDPTATRGHHSPFGLIRLCPRSQFSCSVLGGNTLGSRRRSPIRVTVLRDDPAQTATWEGERGLVTQRSAPMKSVDHVNRQMRFEASFLPCRRSDRPTAAGAFANR